MLIVSIATIEFLYVEVWLSFVRPVCMYACNYACVGVLVGQSTHGKSDGGETVDEKSNFPPDPAPFQNFWWNSKHSSCPQNWDGDTPMYASKLAMSSANGATGSQIHRQRDVVTAGIQAQIRTQLLHAKEDNRNTNCMDSNRYIDLLYTYVCNQSINQW